MRYLHIQEETTMTKTWKRYMLRMLCEGAVMVALAQLLAYLRIW